MGVVMHIPCAINKVLEDKALFSQEDSNTNHERVKIRVMHSGLNNNKSFISDEAVENAKESIKNIPILAYIKRDENGEAIDFDQHNVITKIVKTPDGNKLTEYYLERPIGTVPETTNNYEIEEMNGVNYVSVEGIVWKTYSNEGYDLISESGEKSVSMEIYVEDGKKNKDGVYEIKKFSYLGITVLGDDVPPAMGEECKLETFSSDAVVKEVKKLQKEFTEFQKKLKKSQEEDELMGKDNVETTENFSLSVENMAQDIRNSLYKRKCKKKYSWSDEEYEVQEFYLRTIIPTENIAVLEDNSSEGVSYFGVPFSLNKDEVVLDFENKTEYIQAWRKREKEEDVMVFDDSEELNLVSQKITEMSEKIETLEEDVTTKDNELNKLQEFKLEKDKEALTQEVNTIVSRFSILEETDYKELVDKALSNEITTKALEHELYALRGMKQEKLEKQNVQSFSQEESGGQLRVPINTQIEDKINFSQTSKNSKYGSLSEQLERIALSK